VVFAATQNLLFVSQGLKNMGGRRVRSQLMTQVLSEAGSDYLGQRGIAYLGNWARAPK